MHTDRYKDVSRSRTCKGMMCRGNECCTPELAVSLSGERRAKYSYFYSPKGYIHLDHKLCILHRIWGSEISTLSSPSHAIEGFICIVEYSGIPLEFLNDHLNDISIPENMLLFSPSIHPQRPDLIGSTAYMPCYASRGR